MNSKTTESEHHDQWSLSFVQSIRKAYKTEIILYRQYHRNPWNWLIHCATVPLELFSFFLLAAYLSPRIIVLVHICSWILALYYWIIGISWHSITAGLMMLFLYHAGTFVHHRFNTILYVPIWTIALLLQVMAWFLQVCVGHHLLEQNQPAMTKKLTVNSIALSLLLAWDTSTIH